MAVAKEGFGHAKGTRSEALPRNHHGQRCNDKLYRSGARVTSLQSYKKEQQEIPHKRSPNNGELERREDGQVWHNRTGSTSSNFTWLVL